MPDRVEVQDLTCNAGVTTANPTEIALSGVVACQVVRLTIRIPPGHAGLTGIAFGYGHNPVLPRTAGRFISSDDEVIVYDMQNYPPGPQWEAFLVNQDTIAHSWEVRIEVDELRAFVPASLVQPISSTDITAAAGELIGIGG